jgi:hypothetical protein
VFSELRWEVIVWFVGIGEIDDHYCLNFNINKRNNHLSSYLTEHKQESLNSNGHQFHQYQQNKQSPLILSHWTQRRNLRQKWTSTPAYGFSFVFSEIRWEVIVSFIDIGGIDDHHCLNFFCVQWVTMRGDCLFCWYWWNWWPLLFNKRETVSRNGHKFPPISTKQTITSHLMSLITNEKA